MSEQHTPALEQQEWMQLQALYEASRYAGVSFTLHFSEAEDQFYVTIESNAPTENFISKTRGLSCAIDYTIEHLMGLRK